MPSQVTVELSRTACYKVPVRFGVGAILAMMTTFALLFGSLRFLDAHPAVYLFFGALGAMTGGVQMRFGDVPRGASILAGAIFLPLWMGVWLFLQPPHYWARMPTLAPILALPFLAGIGAFFGYLTGTIVAGIFLTMDSFERWLASRASRMSPR